MSSQVSVSAAALGASRLSVCARAGHSAASDSHAPELSTRGCHADHCSHTFTGGQCYSILKLHESCPAVD